MTVGVGRIDVAVRRSATSCHSPTEATPLGSQGGTPETASKLTGGWSRILLCNPRFTGTGTSMAHRRRPSSCGPSNPLAAASAILCLAGLVGGYPTLFVTSPAAAGGCSTVGAPPGFAVACPSLQAALDAADAHAHITLQSSTPAAVHVTSGLRVTLPLRISAQVPDASPITAIVRGGSRLLDVDIPAGGTLELRGIGLEGGVVAPGDGGGGLIRASTGSAVALHGCRLRNGTAARPDRSSPFLYGGLVLLQGNSSLNATATVFEGGRADAGGCLALFGTARASIVGGTVTGCVANFWAGGLLLDGDSRTNVTGTALADSVGPYGGAVDLGTTAVAYFEACSFVRNSAIRGGGIYAFASSSVVVRGCIFADNTGSSSAGGLDIASTKAWGQVTDSTFVSNHGGSEGGHLRSISDVRTRVHNCSFTGGSADFGGAIFFRGDGVFQVSEVVVNGSRAGIEGGCLWTMRDVDLSVANASFWGCSAGVEGGCVHVRDYFYYDETKPVVLQDVRMAQCEAPSGGAMALADSAAVLATGLSILSSRATAGNGGGVMLVGGASLGMAGASTVADCHAAAGSGGGIHVGIASTLTLGSGVTVQGCSADKGGALAAVRATAVTLSGAVTLRNNSARLGGAVSVATPAEPAQGVCDAPTATGAGLTITGHVASAAGAVTWRDDGRLPLACGPLGLNTAAASAITAWGNVAPQHELLAVAPGTMVLGMPDASAPAPGVPFHLTASLLPDPRQTQQRPGVGLSPFAFGSSVVLVADAAGPGGPSLHTAAVAPVATLNATRLSSVVVFGRPGDSLTLRAGLVPAVADALGATVPAAAVRITLGPCPRGTALGGTACHACPDGSTSHTAGGACEPCGAGLQCRDGAVRVAFGFAPVSSAPVSAVRALGGCPNTSCAVERPCAPPRFGPACSLCPAASAASGPACALCPAPGLVAALVLLLCAARGSLLALAVTRGCAACTPAGSRSLCTAPVGAAVSLAVGSVFAVLPETANPPAAASAAGAGAAPAAVLAASGVGAARAAAGVLLGDAASLARLLSGSACVVEGVTAVGDAALPAVSAAAGLAGCALTLALLALAATGRPPTGAPPSLGRAALLAVAVWAAQAAPLLAVSGARLSACLPGGHSGLDGAAPCAPGGAALLVALPVVLATACAVAAARWSINAAEAALGGPLPAPAAASGARPSSTPFLLDLRAAEHASGAAAGAGAAVVARRERAVSALAAAADPAARALLRPYRPELAAVAGPTRLFAAAAVPALGAAAAWVGGGLVLAVVGPALCCAVALLLVAADPFGHGRGVRCACLSPRLLLPASTGAPRFRHLAATAVASIDAVAVLGAGLVACLAGAASAAAGSAEAASWAGAATAAAWMTIAVPILLATIAACPQAASHQPEPAEIELGVETKPRAQL